MTKQNEAEGLNGVYKQLAKIVGLDNCLEIYKEFKGITVTFPTKLIDSAFVKLELEKSILGGKAYSRQDIQQMAVYYDYSERQIRRYLKEINDRLMREDSNIEETSIPYLANWLQQNKEIER